MWRGTLSASALDVSLLREYSQMVGEFGELWDCGEGVEVAAVLLTIDSLPTHLPIYKLGSAKNRIHHFLSRSVLPICFYLNYLICFTLIFSSNLLIPVVIAFSNLSSLSFLLYPSQFLNILFLRCESKS